MSCRESRLLSRGRETESLAGVRRRYPPNHLPDAYMDANLDHFAEQIYTLGSTGVHISLQTSPDLARSSK
jgi:hypothetical protein